MIPRSRGAENCDTYNVSSYPISLARGRSRRGESLDVWYNVNLDQEHRSRAGEWHFCRGLGLEFRGTDLEQGKTYDVEMSVVIVL